MHSLDEAGAHGFEWLHFATRYGGLPLPLHGSLANLKREIRRWAEGQISARKYRLPDEQRPNRVTSGSSVRLAGRFHLLKTGPDNTSNGRRTELPRSAGGACKRRSRGNTCLRRKPPLKVPWVEVRTERNWKG